MGVELYKNNAGAVLNGTISIGGTVLNLASGQGSRFPTPTGGDDFRITIFEKDAGGTEINHEIVRCTARIADSLTIARDIEGIVVAAGGTSGGWAYPAAVGINPSQIVYVQMRETAGTFDELLAKRGNLAGLASTSTARTNLGAEASANKATDFSTVNHTLFPTVQAVKTYADSLVVGLWDDRGSHNASGDTWPSSGGSGTAGAILKGDIWTISTGGTLGGSVVAAGDTIRALQDTPGTTAANWAIAENNIGYVPENAANKNASGGYAGLSAYKIQLRNDANTYTSLLQSTSTAARTWSFQDRDGTIADLGANTFTGAQVLSDQQLSRAMLKDCGLLFVDKGNSGTSAQTIDYSAASHQKLTVTGAFVMNAVTNWPPTGNTGELLLELVNGASSAITWTMAGTTQKWWKSDGTSVSSIGSSGVTLQTSGTDWILMWSTDAGTTTNFKVMR